MRHDASACNDRLHHPEDISDDATILLVQRFFDDWHYRLLQSSLARHWRREKMLGSALHVLKLNGVPLSEQDVSHLSTMDEEDVIADLVRRIPNMVRKNLDRIIMQTQMMATTALTIRRVAEEDIDANIQTIFEELDRNSMGHEILKSAVVLTSQEAATMRQLQESWLECTESRLARLMERSETAEVATKELLAVEAQLEASFGKAKLKQDMLGLAEGNTTTLMQTCFAAWRGATLAGREEQRIRCQCEQQIVAAQQALISLKEKRMQGIKRVIEREAQEMNGSRLKEAVRLWREVSVQSRLDAESRAKLDSLNTQLHGLKTKSAEGIKKVMGQMTENRDTLLIINAFGAWSQMHEDYKKNKEFEDQVKKVEQLLKDQRDRKREEAKGLLNRMASCTGTSLLTMCISAWAQALAEAQQQRALEKRMREGDCRLKGFMDRYSQNAHGVAVRAIDQANENLTLRCWNAWMTEAKVSHIEKKLLSKVEHKRDQLSKVQHLFKRFAADLDDGLGSAAGDSSARVGRRSWCRPSDAGSDGASALPDIHAPRGPTKRPQSAAQGPRKKDA